MAPMDSAEYEQDELDNDSGEESDVDDGSFKIRGALEAPNPKLYTMQELYDLYMQGYIEVSPPWQRDVVWSEQKRMHLIDSIFTHHYIPPIVLAESADEEGEEIMLCVDGKQRLTSIVGFMSGELYYRDPKTKKRWYYEVPEGSNKLRIPDDGISYFASRTLTCVQYPKLPAGAERQIFQRVQLGMPLTAAEKLRAISGPRADWMDSLVVKHVTIQGGLSEILDWDTDRARDYLCLSQMVYCCDHLDEQVSPSTKKLSDWIAQPNPPSFAFQNDIKTTLDTLYSIAEETIYNKAFRLITSRVAPVEFVYIGVLIFVLKGRNKANIAKACYALRFALRNNFRDVRMNSTVVKAIWYFIEELSHDVNADLSLKGLPDDTAKKRKRASGQAKDDLYRAPAKKRK